MFYYVKDSLLSSATNASLCMVSGTVISFIIWPSINPSRTHNKYAGWIRYIVQQGQLTGSKQKMVLSGLLMASRLTKLISVPTAHLEPGGASLIVFLINSVDPFMSAASTVSFGHSGCTNTVTSGYLLRADSICLPVNLVWPAQWPCHNTI